MTGTPAANSGQNLLGIYLNDHLAGATGGAELARRMAAPRRPPAQRALQRLADEIAEDLAALLEIMAALGIPVRGYKACAAGIGEKAGRLALDCHQLTRTPPSSPE